MSEKDFTDEEQSAAASVLISQQDPMINISWKLVVATIRKIVKPGSKAILEPF
ncbi:8936_t:CDS:2 [Entrophospora sp. SA101]|nr:8395_t:CDS:2 [Entrophospora sp. SA101]CAJ0752076.1 8936_t:CDS:2 [Entrophospora sp. SA101]CAJ0924202.1 21215_t:CDS:2 [Entrophospora sp. SA101]